MTARRTLITLVVRAHIAARAASAVVRLSAGVRHRATLHSRTRRRRTHTLIARTLFIVATMAVRGTCNTLIIRAISTAAVVVVGTLDAFVRRTYAAGAIRIGHALITDRSSTYVTAGAVVVVVNTGAAGAALTAVAQGVVADAEPCVRTASAAVTIGITGTLDADLSIQVAHVAAVAIVVRRTANTQIIFAHIVAAAAAVDGLAAHIEDLATLSALIGTDIIEGSRVLTDTFPVVAGQVRTAVAGLLTHVAFFATSAIGAATINVRFRPI